MKALILNSGIGKRMGELTKDRPKCLVELKKGESILKRQVEQLVSLGLKELVMTTGPFEEKIKKEIKENFPGLKVTYVFNEKYDSTNYIYSMYLAEKYIKDDLILLHGDMVNDLEVLKAIISFNEKDAVIVNSAKPLPEKDFKGKIKDGKVKKIGLDFFGADCVFLLPVYKFSKNSMEIWFSEIEKFIKAGTAGVYAENAFNEVSDRLNLIPLDITDILCMEIDNAEDLEIARKALGYGENVYA
jgi:phosphoenolpyruvate phosphomutase